MFTSSDGYNNIITTTTYKVRIYPNKEQVRAESPSSVENKDNKAAYQ
jgi:hypothetical protein